MRINVQDLKALSHFRLGKLRGSLVSFVCIFVEDRAVVLAGVFAAFYHE